MKKNRISVNAIRHVICVTVALILVSTALVGAVYAKYASRKQLGLSLSVEAYGQIDLSLCEGMNAGSLWASSSHALRVAPGAVQTFDPYVRIGANSESCYLFVKVVESGGEVTANSTSYTFSDFIEYSIADGWTRGDGVGIPSDVLYRTVEKSGTDQFFGIIADDRVTSPDTITEGLLSEFENASAPALTITAYALQLTNLTDPDRDNTTAEGAWAWIMAN